MADALLPPPPLLPPAPALRRLPAHSHPAHPPHHPGLLQQTLCFEPLQAAQLMCQHFCRARALPRMLPGRACKRHAVRHCWPSLPPLP